MEVVDVNGTLRGWRATPSNYDPLPPPRGLAVYSRAGLAIRHIRVNYDGITILRSRRGGAGNRSVPAGVTGLPPAGCAAGGLGQMAEDCSPRRC